MQKIPRSHMQNLMMLVLLKVYVLRYSSTSQRLSDKATHNIYFNREREDVLRNRSQHSISIHFLVLIELQEQLNNI